MYIFPLRTQNNAPLLVHIACQTARMGQQSQSPTVGMAQLASKTIITLIRIPMGALQIIGHPMPLEPNCHTGGMITLCEPVTQLGQTTSHGSELSFY